MYHFCFCEVIHMWCTSFNWEKKLNLPWQYQALKLALFPPANTQCPDEQSATDQCGSNHLNVAIWPLECSYVIYKCSMGWYAPMLGQPKAAAH